MGRAIRPQLSDIFSIQDEITRTIAGRLAPEVAKARVEETRDKPTENLDAWELYLQSRAAQSVYPGFPRWITDLMTCLGDSAIRINAIPSALRANPVSLDG